MLEYFLEFYFDACFLIVIVCFWKPRVQLFGLFWATADPKESHPLFCI